MHLARSYCQIYPLQDWKAVLIPCSNMSDIQAKDWLGWCLQAVTAFPAVLCCSPATLACRSFTSRITSPALHCVCRVQRLLKRLPWILRGRIM